MKIRVFVMIILLTFSLLLTGCARNRTRNDGPVTSTLSALEQEARDQMYASFDYFKELDFSNETIYYHKNFYDYEDFEDIDWEDVIEQNIVVLAPFMKINEHYLSFDDSEVVFETGVKSNLKIIFNEGAGVNSTVKTVPFVYYDVSKNADGSESNAILKHHKFYSHYTTVNGTEYEIFFETFNESGSYKILFRPHSSAENPDRFFNHFHRYSGPKTYSIDGVPVLKLWKDRQGYRIDILDSGETSFDTKNKTEYYVFPKHMSNSRSYLSTPNLYLYLDHYYYSEFSYRIQDFEYDPTTENLQFQFHVFNDDRTVEYTETFTLNDYYTHTFSKSDIDYDVEFTRIDDRVVNVSYKHKEQGHILSIDFAARILEYEEED